MSTMQDRYVALMLTADTMRMDGIKEITPESLYAAWMEGNTPESTDITLDHCRSYLLGNMRHWIFKAAEENAKRTGY